MKYFIVFGGRFIGLTAVASAVEAVITKHVPYDSWSEPIILMLGAIAWAVSDFALKEMK